MVVPARSSGSGTSGNSIEISIRARDEASAIVGQVQVGFDSIARSATIAQVKIVAISAAIAQLAGTSLARLAQVSQVFIGLRTALDTPVTRSVFDQIKTGAQDSLAEIQPLSKVISSVAAAGGVAGKGFLGINKTSIIDDVESRFDKVSQKITGKLVSGFTNLPIEKLPFADKLIPPGLLEAAVGPLDKSLSDVLLNQIIGRKVPGALGGVFKKVAGQELGDTIAGTVRNSPLIGLLGEPAKQLLGGSLLGAIESKISGTLSSAFKLGFVNADSFITAGSTALGRKVGTLIFSQATKGAADNFALFDRLVGGQAQKFINTQLPGLSKQAVEKSGAVQAVRSLTGELTNLISGSVVTGLTGGFISGSAGQGLFQLLGDDLASKGIKNLSGGVLVKVGEQVADITQLTFGARVAFEALFNSVATGTVKSLGSGLIRATFAGLDSVIPAQVKQLFGFIESLFPQEIAAFKEQVIDIVGDFVGGAITNFATSEVDRLQARVGELNDFIQASGATPTAPPAPVDTGLADQLDLAQQADDARSRVADLRQELADLENAPITAREELVKVHLDTTLDPAEKARLITDLTAQIQAAEAALESPVDLLKAQLRELEAVIEAAPVTTPTPQIAPQLQQELDLAADAESAQNQIAGLQLELEELNATPLELQADLEQLDLDTTLPAETVARLRADITQELADTEAAIAPRVEEIQREMARLNTVVAAAPRGVAEVLQEIENARLAIPVDSDEVVAAKAEVAALEGEIARLQAQPDILKEELVRVQLDTEIPDDQRRELVTNLTRDIQDAEAVLDATVTQIKSEIAVLNDTIANTPVVEPAAVAVDTPQIDTQPVTLQVDSSQAVDAAEDVAALNDQLQQTTAAPRTSQSIANRILDLAIAAEEAQTEIADLESEIELLNQTPLSLQNEIEAINQELSTLGEGDSGADALVLQRDELAAELTTTQAAIAPRISEIQREIARLNEVVTIAPLSIDEAFTNLGTVPPTITTVVDVDDSQLQTLEAEVNGLAATAPTITVDVDTAQPDAPTLPDDALLIEQFEAAERAKEEIIRVREELADLQSEPLALKEELVRVTLDTEIPEDQKQELVENLTRDIREAELILRDPITQIQAEIEALNEVIARSPATVDDILQSRTTTTPATPVRAAAPQTVEDFEAIENARTELAALEAQIAALNANPITLRADLERVKLDTGISDADKQALIANLTKQITDAEAAIQSPLQRLALQITGIIGNASSESGGTLIIDIERIFNQVDGFLEGTLSASFTEIGRNAAGGFSKGLGDALFAELAPIFDQVDGFVRGTISKIQEIPGRFTEPLGQISGAFTAIAGVNEPLALFQGIQEKASEAFGAVAKVGEQITFFQSGFETLQSLVTNGPFELLIGQNIKLNEQLLSTKASLVSTNQILDGFAGKQITATAGQKASGISDVQAQIIALDAPVNAAIDRVRKGSLELSGVTSSQLIEGFQVVAQNASSIGLSLEQSADTTLSFAAALGTLGVPLDQARQEVTSILTAQISSDSVVAKSLGITNEQVRLYKSQGKVFEFLQDKLAAFRGGNALAAESVGGLTSNIQEVFENIALEAGKPLLGPITEELKGIFDYLKANQGALTESVSAIALNLFEGIKAAFDAVQTIGKAFEGVLSQIPEYLFGSLSNFLKVVAQSATNTVQALAPMIDIFSRLFEAIRPLAGPFLQIAIQAKALQVGISALGNSFGFLSNLLPGVGDLMFGVNARTLPLVNLFPALAGSLGSGAAGFLLLGQNMNAIPGLASQVVAKLGLFGPLAPLVAGLIPSVAGVGITIAGLAKNFPPLQNGLDKLFATNPADLVSGLKSFTGLVPGLGFLNPLLDAASDKVRVLAGNQSLSAFATTQFNAALKLAGIQLRNFLVSTALLGAGLYLAFLAVDRFILKNEALLEVLRGVGEGIKNALGVLLEFATNPFFTSIAVTIGVAVIAANGLHVALLRLIATQLAGWAAGVAGGLGQMAGFLNLIRLSSLATGAAQASVGLQGLAIALTEGSVKSAEFLSKQGVNVVSLNSLKTSLIGATTQVKLFAVGLLEAAGNAFKSFIAGIGSIATQIRTLITAAASGGVSGVVNAIQAEVIARTTSIVVQKEAALSAAQLAVVEKQAAVATAELAFAQNGTAVSSQALSVAQKELTIAQQQVAVTELELTAAKEAQVAATTKVLTAEQAEAIAIAEGNVARTQSALLTAQNAAAQSAAAVSAIQFTLAQQQAALTVAELAFAEKSAAVAVAELAFAEQGTAVAATQLTLAQQAQAVAATEVTVAQQACSSTAGRLAVAEQAATAATAQLAVAQQAATIASTQLATAQTAATSTGGGLGALLGKLGTGFSSVASSVAVLITNIGQAIAGFVAMAAPIALVVGAIAAIGLVVQTQRLKGSLQEVEKQGIATNAAFDTALQTAQKLKSARAIQDERTKNGIKLTQEEYAANQELLKQANERQKQLDAQIAKLEAAKKKAVGDEDKGNLDGQIDQLKKAKETLTSFSSNIQLAPKDLPRVGTAFEQLAEKAKSAQEAVNNSSGDNELFKQKAAELIEITNTQLEQGQITEDAARKRLDDLATNTSADAETQIKAQQAITETYKKEAQEQVDARSAASEKVQAGIESGRIKEIDGERQLTKLKAEEITIQLQAAQAGHDKRIALLDEEYKKTLEFLQAELAARQADVGKATTPQDKEEKTKILQATQAKITELETAHNESRTNAEQKFGIERDKLQAQQEKNAAEGAKREQEARLKAVEKANKTANDTIQKTQNDRLINTQRLANSGAISQAEAEEAKVKAAATSNQAQIDAEAKKQNELAALIKSAPTAKAREELELQLRDSRLKSQDLVLKSLENEQKAHEAHIAVVKSAIEKGNTQEQIALQKRINSGQATESEAADLRADQKIEVLQAEIALEKAGSEKRLQLELELQSSIRAAQEAELAKRKEQLEGEQIVEQIALEKRINAGLASEAEAGDLRADQKVDQIEQELSLEGLSKQRRLQLELELQSSIRAAREAELGKLREQLENEQTVAQIALEKRINAGQATEAEAADLSADQKVDQIEQELSLEGLSQSKRLQLELELQRAIRSARETEQGKRRAELEDEQNLVLLALEKQINAGEISQGEVARVRASQKVAQIQQELDLETTNNSKRIKLELDLQQALGEVREAELAEQKEKLEQANQAAENQIEAQNQKLRNQGQIFDVLTQSMENRNRLLQAGANLIKAQSDFAVNELNILSQGEKSEFRKRQLAEITAAIRLKALEQEQAFQRESLRMELEKQKLAIENERIQNRIAVGEQQANIAKARADVDIAKLDPKTTKPQLEALQLRLQAEVDKGGFLQAQGGLIDQKAQIGEKELAIRAAQQGFEQRTALRGAQAELARALPPGQRNRAEQQIRQLVSEDLGAKDYQDLRMKGLASSRQLAAESFGGTVTAPLPFDAEQYDMARKIQGVQQTFGAAAVTPAPGAIIPAGTEPLALPQVDLKGLGLSFENSGQMFVSGIDRLVKALDNGVGGGGQNINVSLTTPTGTQKATVAASSNQQPSIAEVIKYTKQLVGI